MEMCVSQGCSALAIIYIYQLVNDAHSTYFVSGRTA